MTDTNQFSDAVDKLELFKKYIRTDFKKHCETNYGKYNYNMYIAPYLDDMLECVEYHIEDLAEEAVHNEEIYYEDEEEDVDEDTDE